MPLTVQKLQIRLRELRQAIEEPGQALAPVLSAPADGPMTLPPQADDARWQRLEQGQTWGLPYGTCWLQTTLPAYQFPAGHIPVLQLLWDKGAEDNLFRRLEATVFLDDLAIGAFDWRHPLLALPTTGTANRLWQEGQTHKLYLQVYTRQPIPFEGLFLRIRHEQLYRLNEVMQTLLDVSLTFAEHDAVGQRLLALLNQTYNMLDLREGWKSQRLRASVAQSLGFIEAHLAELNAQGTSSSLQPQITISGHAHLDVAWLWPYWRTHQKIAHTVANVLSLMERYPDYHYSQSQPQLLQWLKEDLPELYARVKERVVEGRFEPVGAMWVEADCNLTSGESLVRQIIHGTHFMRDEFGITPRLIWLPDVFGYSAALPQIMRLCNIPCFMTTKISWNQFNRLPVDTFRWRGIDGTEILTHFITAPDESAKSTYYTYNGPLKPADMVGTWQNYQQPGLNNQFLYLGGWGDGGGGPVEDQLGRAEIMANLPGFPRVRLGRVDEYFDDLYQRLWENPQLPTWVGELYLEYHRGTYTSQARTKQANRRAELLYRDVELLNSWASLYGTPTRQEELNVGWKLILLNQFHDVLPGSSIHEVYEDVAQIYAQINALAEPIQSEAIANLHTNLGTNDEGQAALLLLNTLPWERGGSTIQLSGDYSQLLPQAQLGRDWKDQPLTLLDGLSIPSCGALLTTAAFHTVPDNAATQAYTTTDGHLTLQNAFFTLSLDAYGEINSLYDRQAQREVLAPGQTANQLIAYEDRPLNFDAWDIDLYYEEKPYPLREEVQTHIIETGPVRATIEVERRWLDSRITQRISLWRDSRRIDFATEIDWHQHQTLLKAAFPVAINATRATYEIQFGHIERPTHRNTSWDQARFEVCAHRWADLSESGYGVSLLNDSKYGYDIHDNVMRLTLLKSAIAPDPEADQGIHHFTYSLLPHQGDWRTARTLRHAYELNVPIRAVPAYLAADAHKAVTSSFISTDCPHVVVETVKPAEDGQGLIVRLYEAHNQRGNGTLTFAAPLLAAEECNLLEESLESAHYQGTNLSFQVRPFEIKTFRIQLARLS